MFEIAPAERFDMLVDRVLVLQKGEDGIETLKTIDKFLGRSGVSGYFGERGADCDDGLASKFGLAVRLSTRAGHRWLALARGEGCYGLRSRWSEGTLRDGGCSPVDGQDNAGDER